MTDEAANRPVRVDPDRGCRGVLIWLAIIATTFAVCVAVGIGIFVLNLREHAGNAVHQDLFALIETAELSSDEKVALRVRVDGLVEAYQSERMSQDDFLAEVVPLREELVAKQPPPLDSTGGEAAGPETAD